MTASTECYRKLFLRGYPVKLLIPVIMENLNDFHSYENQKIILKNTISSELVKQYPLKLEYMMSFAKLFLQQLEDNNIEVSDAWYETYCELLSVCSTTRNTHFKHFIIDDSEEKFVTIEENVSLISQGTTGLSTWQASQTLVNWCSNNSSLLQNKCVLELGSGVGLAGLTICFKCEPKSFWFTDCHPSVLGMLMSNVKINVDREKNLSSLEDKTPDKLPSCGVSSGVINNILYQGSVRTTTLYVMNLPWEDVPGEDIRSTICPDIVLAADVIYDSSSFEPLIGALCHLITEKCMAVLTCTVRNEDTLNQFLDMLEHYNLSVEEGSVGENDNTLNLEDIPIRIFQIRK